MHNIAQNGRVSKLAATAAGVLGIRAVGQASAEGTLEMLGKCRGERKNAREIFYAGRWERLGYKGGSVRIGQLRERGVFALGTVYGARARFRIDRSARRYPARGALAQGLTVAVAAAATST